jgi:hypothetical protein
VTPDDDPERSKHVVISDVVQNSVALTVYKKFKIKMNLREIGRSVLDWIYLAQDRDQWRTVVNTVMNLRVP